MEVTGLSFWGPHEGNKGGLRLFWESKAGFGTFDIVQEKDGTIFIDTECMGKEDVLKALANLISNAKTDVSNHEEPSRTEWPAYKDLME